MRKYFYLIFICLCYFHISSSVLANSQGYIPYRHIAGRQMPRRDMVFTGKVVGKDMYATIYRRGNRLIYTAGKHGKPNLVLEGVPGQNLFFYSTSFGTQTEKYIRFTYNNYSYILYSLEVYDKWTEELIVNDYTLRAYQGMKLVFDREIDPDTTLDFLFNDVFDQLWNYVPKDEYSFF